MKKIFILVLTLFSVAIKAQEVTSYGKSTAGVVKLYFPKTQQQSDLENIGAIRKQKKKLGGFGGVSFTYEIQGEKSMVRLNADSAIFVVEQGTGIFSMDISMTLILYKLEIKGGSRIAVQGDYNSSVVGSGKTTDTKITTGIKPIKDGLKQIMPEKKLEKGEYAFVSNMMEGNNYDGKNTKYIVYAFGID